MAKRAVIEHPKFARLKSCLKCNRATALGYLECLWHFTGRFTPQGDIGKFSDEEIEAWAEWDGEPGDLIHAFVECRWIDRDDVCRIIVHDWQDHADNATRMTLKRAQLDFTEPVPVGSTVETPLKQGVNSVDTESAESATVLAPPSHPSPPHPMPSHAMPSKKREPKEKPQRKIIPPEQGWVFEYATRISLPRNEADAFFDHFTSSGWKLSNGNAMKDWQSSMNRWKARQGQFGGNPPRSLRSRHDELMGRTG